jgi:hypothetical protein
MARIRKQAARRVEERHSLKPKMAGHAQLDPAWAPVGDHAPSDRKAAPSAGRTGGRGARAERPSEGGKERAEEAAHSEPTRTKAPSPTS